MGVAKVVLNGDTLMDTTSKTVAADKMLATYTALDKAGNNITGNIAAKTSSDLTTSGATVTAPAGYYASNATKTIPSGSATPGGNISVGGAAVSSGTGIITLSKTISDTPSVSAGYISTGTAGNRNISLSADMAIRSSSDLTSSGATVTAPAGYYASDASKAVANGSVTVPSSISGTSATVSTGTNTLTLTKTVAVTPSVTTAGYISSGTAGNSSVSLTASVTTKAATTYNTSGSNQTIASGTYLTGTQTIRGVSTSGISAANIKDGVTIKVGDSADDDRITAVTGTFTDASTVSSGQTAANGSKLLSGYSAWVDGTEIKGSIGTMTLPSEPTTSGLGTKAGRIEPHTGNSTNYLNIPIGYNGATAYYEIPPIGTLTFPTSTSSGYVGTQQAAITPSSSIQYLNIGTGYNSSNIHYKINAMPTGTAGTPTATKGTVSNHQISITPSVTNTTGYITGSTKTGTAVTVTASELASGNKEITENGTGIDVVGYSTVSVNVSSGPAYTGILLNSAPNIYGDYGYIRVNGNTYRTANDSFEYHAGDTILIIAMCVSNASITIDDVVVASGSGSAMYSYTAPSHNIEVSFATGGQISITEAAPTGLIYESGTWTPASDTSDEYIYFTNTYSAPPMFAMIVDAAGTADSTTYTNYGVTISNFYGYIGGGIPYGTNTFSYGYVERYYRQTGTNATSSVQRFAYTPDISGTSSTYYSYWISNTYIRAYTGGSSCLWRSGRTYKWIAVWPPT